MIDNYISSQIDKIKMNCERINPLVTIHCITYNHEPYIKDALDGFVMQKTNFPFVAIVHDDASSDDTSKIIKEYAENYPEIIFPIFEKENQFSKANKSFKIVTEIMNLAVESTGSKYVAYCEGDDYWIDPNKLQKQVNFLESHPNVTLHFHNALINNDTDQHYSFFSLFRTGYFEKKELYKKWIVPTASILIKNSIFHSALYLKSLKYTANFVAIDNLVILIASYYGDIWGENEFYSVYRKHPGGIMNTFELIPDKLLQHSIYMRKLFGKYLYPIISENIGEFACIGISNIFKLNFKQGFKLLIKSFYYSPIFSLKKIYYWIIKTKFKY